ncbi:MAG TPA: ABC transporter ATP-binding protein [Sphingobacteriaceae bacterium]
MSSPIICLSKVSKQYAENIHAGVSDINVSIEKGDFVAIIGESGSGKSTLLKLIFGLLAPDQGEVSFQGRHVSGPHEKLIPGHDRMRMVAQDFNLNTYAKVYDNIASMLSNDDLISKKEKTVETMEFLRIDHLAQKRIVELSGGEQQRVAIARAIISQPEVLLLDEPFSQIDTILKHDLRDDLRRLSKYLGITIILVSHDPMDGLSLADKIVVLRQGRLVQEGPPREVVNNPASGYVASLLGDANVLSPEEAAVLGIVVDRNNQVVIYPNQIDLNDGNLQGTVKRVLYKLFYDEIILDAGGVDLTAHSRTLTLAEGQDVFYSAAGYSIVEG